jgi:hypothetical protein
VAKISGVTTIISPPKPVLETKYGPLRVANIKSKKKITIGTMR